MAAREEWDDVIARILAADVPAKSPHVRRLYEIAVDDGRRFLASFRHQIDDERALDLVHDVLAMNLEDVLAAETPRAFFCVAVRRRAVSWLRRGDAAVAAADDAERGSGVDEDERRGFLLDARSLLADLSERDRAIVVAVAAGEDVAVVARELGVSPANIYQIVSRARKRCKEST